MKLGKRLLSKALVALMLLGLLPTSVWASTASILIAPSQVYIQAYNFDQDGVAAVRPDWNEFVDVTVVDGQLVTIGETATATTERWTRTMDETTGLQGYGLYDYETDTSTPRVANQFDEVYSYSLYPDSVNYFFARVGETWDLYDLTGAAVGLSGVVSVSSADTNTYKITNADGLSGLVSTETGSILVPMAYDSISYSDTLADGTACYWVTQGDSTLVVDSAGTVHFTLPTDVYRAGLFDGGPLLVVMNSDKLYGAVNLAGELVIDCTYYYISSIGQSCYMVREESSGSYAMMDSTGTLLTDFVFPNLPQSFNGLGRTTMKNSDGLYGLMDTSGNYVSDLYAAIYTAEEGMWSARNDEGYYALMSNDGVLLTDFIFTEVVGFYDGLSWAATDDGYGIIDTMGQIQVPMSYNFSYLMYQELNAAPYAWITTAADESIVCQVEGLDNPIAYGVVAMDYTATVTPQSTTMMVNGVSMTVDAYATLDASGNPTNYYKLRDIASILNGSDSQFSVGWSGSVDIVTGAAYTPNGTEMSVPFSGVQVGNDINATTIVNGKTVAMDTITLTDDAGNGYTYYKLRDLGGALGFDVDWDSANSCIVINSK